MKINRKLIAAFAMMSVAFAACTSTTPDVDCGEKPEMAGPANVVWYEAGSSSSSLAVVWDAAGAINAGATSFTVQLLKDVNETPDPYNSSNSVVVLATTNYEGSANVTEEDAKKDPCDQGVFSNLVKGKCYYIRVRANYPGSIYTPWVFCANEDGTPARIKVGKGIVPADEEEDKTAPTAKIAYKDATGAIVTWSTYNWANHAADFTMAYTLEIKKGNELVVKWHIPANSEIWSAYATEGCRFYISGLEPETEYTATVANVTDGVAADPVKFTTDASKVVELPATPAAAGDVILHEDFSMLLITGDLSRHAAGYSYVKRSESDSSWKATGDNPVSTQTDWGCYLVDPSTEVGLFNTIKGVVASSRLKTWGMMAEDDTKGAICARPGYCKMGASSKCAWLVTPELTCLAQPAKVELSFDAALYESDPRTCIVEVLTGCTQEEVNNFVRPGARNTAANFEVGAVAGEWAHYTFTIDNVMPGSRIAIGADRAGVDDHHRFYLDNVEVKVLSYGQLTLTAPANLALTATDTTIEATWDAVANTKEYVVEYKTKAATEWTALAPVAETKATITGLAFETEYEVRVKATADDVTSEYSEVATIKTLAEIKKLGTPAEVVAVGGITTVTLTFPAVTNATGYEVYAGETKLESVSSEAEGVVTVIATGLAQETKVSLQVKATAEGVESSELSAAVEATTGKIFEYRSAGLEYNPTTLTVEWTDYRAGHDYTISLAKADGTVLGTWDVTFSASSLYYGTGEKTVCPARFTFPGLMPASTYKVSVKDKGADDKAYTVIELATSAVRPATDKDVLWNGFDDCVLAGDSHNIASSFLVKDNATALATVWPLTDDYVYGTLVGKIGTCSGADNSGQITNPAIADANCSLYGYAFAAVEMHAGFLKVGAGSTIGTVTTAALGDKVLKADAATACTVSFKVSPRSDTNLCEGKVKLVVVHADGTETVAASGLEIVTDNNPLNYTWRKHEVKNVQLLSTDKIKVSADTDTASGKYRFHLDDILVVAE